MSHLRPHVLNAALVSLAELAACGSSERSRKEPNLVQVSSEPRHDFTTTWVYAVGEVDAPSPNDCRKALGLVEHESECVGAICRYGANLLKDFDAVCRKMTSPAQRKKASELRSSLTSRASQTPSDCAKAANEWLERGCGKDGACEQEARQWAARCSEEIKSPLAMRLLERLVENSLSEPRRIAFDVQGCQASKKKLEAAARCGTVFDCEEGLERVDEYVERCAEGNHKGLPLEQAVQVMRIRFGANKATDPISITKGKHKVTEQSGLLTFADGSGAVVRVCDEPVTDLSKYLEQRRQCENGTITVFMSVETGDGTNLEVRHLRHLSDASFVAAHPELLVKGEAARRSASTP